MHNLDQLKDLSAALAQELAADIHPPQEVFERHAITPANAKRLMMSPLFQSMLREAKSEWGSLKNSKQRLQVKARLAMEEAIPTVFSMIGDTDLPAAARVAAFKEIKEAANVSQVDETGSTGLPSVTIYLGSPDGPSIQVGGKRQTIPQEVIDGEAQEAEEPVEDADAPEYAEDGAGGEELRVLPGFDELELPEPGARRERLDWPQDW